MKILQFEISDDVNQHASCRFSPRTKEAEKKLLELYESGKLHELARNGNSIIMSKFVLEECGSIEFRISLADGVISEVLPLIRTAEYCNNKHKYEDYTEKELEETMLVQVRLAHAK